MLVANFEKYDDRKKLHYAKMVRNAAETNFNLTQNLLVWSLKQHQGYEVVKTSQKIQEIIEHVWTSLSGIAELKNILVELDIPNKTALFDPEIVSTILNNLLTNAIKFANADTIIKVVGIFSDEELILVVYNEGSIVPLEKLNSITTYVKSATTDETYKVGFGLKIAKELALLHHGFIEFYSEKGATEVHLILKNT